MNIYIRTVGYRRKRLAKGIGSNQFETKDRAIEHGKHPSLEWGLSLEQYIPLVTASCYYCGRDPHQTPKGAYMPPDLKRNGIDRVDNNVGYTLANCVSCCTYCNREKRAQSLEQFLGNTRRRYEHLKAEGLL